MTAFETVIILICIAILAVSVISLVIVLTKKNKDNTNEITDIMRDEISRQMSVQRQELSSQMQNTVKTMGDMISSSQTAKMTQLEERIKTFSLENEQKLENIRHSVEKRLEYLQKASKNT